MIELISTLIEDVEDVIFIGHFPDNCRDNICTFYNTPGRPPIVTFLNGSVIRQPSFQVRVRDSSYSSGLERMNYIVETLMVANIGKVINITLDSDIIDIGRDDHNRAEFTANFSYMLESI